MWALLPESCGIVTSGDGGLLHLPLQPKSRTGEARGAFNRSSQQEKRGARQISPALSYLGLRRSIGFGDGFAVEQRLYYELP